MMARLTEEHLDAITYAHTLREQLRQVLAGLDRGEPALAREQLRAILEDAPVD